MSVMMPFKNKQRRIFRESVYTEVIIVDSFKKFLNLNELPAIFTETHTFRIVQSVKCFM